jgi:hypothetical protein
MGVKQGTCSRDGSDQRVEPQPALGGEPANPTGRFRPPTADPTVKRGRRNQARLDPIRRAEAEVELLQPQLALTQHLFFLDGLAGAYQAFIAGPLRHVPGPAPGERRMCRRTEPDEWSPAPVRAVVERAIARASRVGHFIMIEARCTQRLVRLQLFRCISLVG